MRHLQWATRRLDAEDGQSLVEFALVLSVLLLLLMGIFDFGRAFYASTALSNAVRDAARVGITYPTQSECENHKNTIKDKVKDSSIGLDTSSTVMIITVDCKTYELNVKVDYKFYAVTGLISRYFGTDGYLTLHAETTMTRAR